MPAKSLAAALAAPPAHHRAKTECLIVEVTRKMRKAEREAVITEVDDLRWSSRALAKVLTDNGVVVSATVIANHRRGMCPCYRNAEAEK